MLGGDCTPPPPTTHATHHGHDASYSKALVALYHPMSSTMFESQNWCYNRPGRTTPHFRQ